MSYALTASTPAGARVLDVVEGLTPSLRARAAAADRDNAICAGNFDDIRTSGLQGAFVPSELGGFGLDSMHDWIAAIARLARAEPSVAIAMNMHFSATRGLLNVWRSSASSDAARARAADLLGQIGAGTVLICSTTTESGTDNLHPLTEAVRTDTGWRVSGVKHFVTMSPIATHVSLNVRAEGPEGDSIANVFMPMSTPGIEPQGDWDALGMRGSGSQSIVFDACEVPADAVRFIGPWGRWSTPVLIHRTVANTPLVGAFLGIAERAIELTLVAAKSTHKTVSAGLLHTVAEMEIAVATSQCLMSMTGQRLDHFLTTNLSPTIEDGHELMKDYQSVKWVVNQQAIEIVSQAMDVAGGGGFLNRNELTRLYRDVRAGPFMQPYSRVDARHYVGRVAVGHLPVD
ncbi:MAG: acyl-CoA dehydrogenase [Gammaproteobacteria bacterium]|nr:acyl-CoA dehydrogenase [Gammaproteobacteria bacterium]